MIEVIAPRSRKTFKYGVVVLTSIVINENDLFAKLVDAGLSIANVDDQLSLIRELQAFVVQAKVGNIIAITRPESAAFRMQVAANTPSGFIDSLEDS